jgi:integrase
MRQQATNNTIAVAGVEASTSSLQHRVSSQRKSTFSAHGLRSGYLTEAANRGVPLQEAMQQSLHKSVTQAASYYNNAERKNGRAARLLV